jgi:IS5 family transposase
LGGPLAAWNAVLAGTIFDPVPARIPRAEPRAPGGRPACRPRTPFKILVRQSLSGLSDEPAPFQIRDRRSFHPFLGLTAAGPGPDQNPLRAFRAPLPRAELFSELFAAFQARLTQPGFSTRQGQIMAAAFVEVPRQRNRREANAAIQRGEAPAGGAADAKRPAHKDLAARRTQKNQQTCDGCKEHRVADLEGKLIGRAAVTAAGEPDRQARDPLTRAAEPPTWADSADAGAPCAAIFAAKGIVAHLCEKGGRGQALTKGQKRSNRAQSRPRARGEHLFGFTAGSRGAMFQRAIGLARNRAGIILTNLAYNLARTGQIIRLKRLGRKPPQRA